ncbi:MAG: hypothetical protein VYE68_04630, partial [Acidobacteriota bacterium]|nr:hypothetical protein [Acidobacteriota bacterium]
MTSTLTRREFGLSTALALSTATAGLRPARAAAQPATPLYFDLHIDTPARLLNERLNLAESLDYT